MKACTKTDDDGGYKITASIEKFKVDYQKVMNNNDMGRKRKVNSFDVLLGGKPATQTPYVAERWQMQADPIPTNP